MEKKTASAHSQILKCYQRAEELKVLVGRKKKVVFDNESWMEHQELQSILRKLLVKDLDFALDKKVEVDLWNYCFKDYISSLQAQTRDKSVAAKKKQATLSWFLDMASGFYVMLLEEMRFTFGLDVPFLKSDSSYGLFEANKKMPSESSPHPNNCTYIVQYCLVHLGDIARYRNLLKQADTFYHQAILVAPGSGQAYNQIALLEAIHGNKLSSIFFYVRALALRFPFPAAASNLSKMLSRLEQEQGQLPSRSTKINGPMFVQYVLRFFARIHHADNLRGAIKIFRLLDESMKSLIATESLSKCQLIEILAISLFLMHQYVEGFGRKEDLCQDETEIVRLLSEFLGAMLHAFLLPVYTLKQGESLLDYFALPATKLLMDWIILHPKALQEGGFLRRTHVWPSFCKMLNELSALIHGKEDKLKGLENYPLPEDYDLQAFVPLLPLLKQYNFKHIDTPGREIIPTDVQRLLRAKRVVEQGFRLSEEVFAGEKLISVIASSPGESSPPHQFEAIERKIPPDVIAKLNELDLVSLSGEEDESVSPSAEKPLGASHGQVGAPKPPLAMPEPARHSSSSRAKRTNVAISAILRQANSAHEADPRQAPFRSPSPAPSSSQDSNSHFSQEGASVEGARFFSPPPLDLSLPPPAVAVVPHSAPTFRSVASASDEWGAPSPLPSFGCALGSFPNRDYAPSPGQFSPAPGSSFASSGLRGHQAMGAAAALQAGGVHDPLFQLAAGQTGADWAGGGAVAQPSIPGTAYSLFSGPSWALSPSLSGQERGPRDAGATGSSTLEQLLRQHRNQ